MSLKDPTKKMSKSDPNVNATVFSGRRAGHVIRRKFKKAVTDSGTTIEFDETRPAINNLLNIYKIFSGKSEEECISHFEGKGYGVFKPELAEAVVEGLQPIQERIAGIDDEEVLARVSRKVLKRQPMLRQRLCRIHLEKWD